MLSELVRRFFQLRIGTVSELLAEGRGRLFNFNDSIKLTSTLSELLDKPEELNELKQKAYDSGRKITWPKKTSEKYIELAENILKEGFEVIVKKDTVMDFLILPPFSLTHINRLTDDTGIIQHAKFGIPNLKEGYCFDDDARALLMVLMAYRQMKKYPGI